ncbi:MAG: nucleotide exchange factor GrpE [Erysipelotrichaceae bacterium]
MEKRIKMEEKNEHPKKHKVHELELEIESLKNSIEELKTANTKLSNDYYKAYADAENIKKRTQQDLETSKKYRIQNFVLDILPALDNLERSIKAAEDLDSPLIKGIIMTHQQLLNSLKKEGVEEIDALNKPLDPQLHHSILSDQVEGIEPNIVIEVLQKGYTLKDRLLRAALVKVSE